MLYDLSLTIDYSYDAASDRTRNILRLLPSNVDGVQQVRQRLLTILPRPDERRDGWDFFGNEMSMVAWHHPIDAISMQLTAQIERFEPASLFDLSPPLEELRAEILALKSLAPDAPHHFLAASPRVALSPKITDYGWDCLKDAGEGGNGAQSRRSGRSRAQSRHEFRPGSPRMWIRRPRWRSRTGTGSVRISPIS